MNFNFFFFNFWMSNIWGAVLGINVVSEMQVWWICLSATTKRKYRDKEYHVPLQISSSCIFVLSSFVLLERISSGVTSLTWVYLCIWLMLPFIYFPLQLWIISVVISFFLIHSISGPPTLTTFCISPFCLISQVP